MYPWIGGAYVARDHKGDPNARLPVIVVQVEKQRAALRYIMDQPSRARPTGLTPGMLRTVASGQVWADQGSQADIFQEAAYPIHDRIMGVQATALAFLLSPTTLKPSTTTRLNTPRTRTPSTLPERSGPPCPPRSGPSLINPAQAAERPATR